VYLIFFMGNSPQKLKVEAQIAGSSAGLMLEPESPASVSAEIVRKNHEAHLTECPGPPSAAKTRNQTQNGLLNLAREANEVKSNQGLAS
jgi:hypothetical protein